MTRIRYTLSMTRPRSHLFPVKMEVKGGLFVAPDYDILVDCAIEIGTFKQRTFSVRGVPHHLVIHGDGNYDEEALVRDVRKIVETEVAILRHIPYRHYTFLLHNAP